MISAAAAGAGMARSARVERKQGQHDAYKSQ